MCGESPEGIREGGLIMNMKIEKVEKLYISITFETRRDRDAFYESLCNLNANTNI